MSQYLKVKLALVSCHVFQFKDLKTQASYPLFEIPIPDNMGKETDEKKLIKDDRRYISKVIVISVVLILMHTFYIILTHPDHEGLSVGGGV